MSASGKTIIVTGGTDGIGAATVRALAGQGAHVVIVGRNRAKAENLIADIAGKSHGAKLGFVQCDLSSLASIRAAGAEILASQPRIDVLVNNAGGFFAKRELTVDGHERTFALNHLAYAQLTDILLPRLKASAPSRIVSVASGVHATGVLRFDDLMGEKRYGGWAAYCNSKLANVAWTYALARRLEGSGVTANCLHPGFVASQFGKNNRGIVGATLGFAQRFGAIGVEDGAKTSIHLAASPEVEGVSGKYFHLCRETVSSAASRDEAAQEKLWRATEALLSKGA